jgi:hypothetical protein
MLVPTSRFRGILYALVAALLGGYLAGSTAHATKSTQRAARSGRKATRDAAPAPALGPKALIGSNVLVNNPNADDPATLHIQSETSIAVNPVSGTICVGFNDYLTQWGIKFASSNDDGASFQDRGPVPGIPQPPPAPGDLHAVSDTTIIWRRFDNKFYLASVLGDADGLGLWVSNDDCKTFTPAVIVVSLPTGADKPMLAVDNDPSSLYYGRVYATWKAPYQRAAVSYSDDMTTWSSPQLLTADAGNNGPWAMATWPVVMPGGRVYIFWSQFNGETYDIKYALSTNGGGSFPTILPAVSGVITPYNAAATAAAGSDSFDPYLNGGLKAEPLVQVAVDSDSCLHLVYPAGPNTSHTGDCSDIYYRRSCDGGAHWTTPAIKINDDGTATDQWSPTISTGPGGIVSIAYYDRRRSPSNLNFDYYNRVSLDKGNSFQPSTRISSSALPSPLALGLGGYHGDYDMQAQRPGALYLLWSDDRDVTAGKNSPDVFFQKVCPQAGCTVTPAQPRQLAPLSGSKVTSRRPNFKVKLGNGASGVRVDVCRDRACTNIVTTARVIGSTATPTIDLPTGMLFWRAYGTSGVTDGLAPSATWEFRVTPLNALVKTSWGAEPDYSGDGRADAAFSARDAGGGTGKVYVYNSDGSAAGIPVKASRVLLPPSATDTAFGQALSSAGDLNGDGFADLVVSANHGASGSGILYVYYGSPSGIATHAAASINPPATAAAFGRPQAAGDVNCDGYADLLVTDPGYIATNTYGRAYIYYGGPAGLPAAPSQVLDPPRTSAYYFYGYYDGSAGDVNGDGCGDVVIASYMPVTESATYLYLGGVNGLRTPTQVTASSATPVASQGIAFGDVNGDGLSDITIGVTPPGGVPLVALYTGSLTAPGGFNSPPLVYGNAPGTMHDGDTDNNGFDDLIMAITATSTSPGVIYVYSGGGLGYFPLPSSVTNGPDGNNSGWANALGTLGDVDGDGRIDSGVGAVLAASSAGKFYLYRGTSGGLAATPAQTLPGPDGAQSLFGGLIGGVN